MNGGSTTGERRRFAFAAPENFTRSERGCPPSCSDLPIRGRSWVNPGHHGSEKQMFGAKQQLLHGGREGRLRRRFANERRVDPG